jgi:hypothetical protein
MPSAGRDGFAARDPLLAGFAMAVLGFDSVTKMFSGPVVLDRFTLRWPTASWQLSSDRRGREDHRSASPVARTGHVGFDPMDGRAIDAWRPKTATWRWSFNSRALPASHQQERSIFAAELPASRRNRARSIRRRRTGIAELLTARLTRSGGRLRAPRGRVVRRPNCLLLDEPLPASTRCCAPSREPLRTGACRQPITTLW